MPRSIRKTARANDDLVDIWQYSSDRWGEQRADDYLDQLDTQIQGLLRNPGLGRSFDDVRPGYRALHVNRHMVFYAVSDDTILIVRVLHDRMDPSRNLAD